MIRVSPRSLHGIIMGIVLTLSHEGLWPYPACFLAFLYLYFFFWYSHCLLDRFGKEIWSIFSHPFIYGDRCHISDLSIWAFESRICSFLYFESCDFLSHTSIQLYVLVDHGDWSSSTWCILQKKNYFTFFLYIRSWYYSPNWSIIHCLSLEFYHWHDLLSFFGYVVSSSE